MESKPIRAISLWQPWASLVVIGAKTWETRSWDTSYHGPLAIHAAKRWTPAQRVLVGQEPFKSALMAAGIYELPLGKILGKVDLLCTGEIVEHGKIWYAFSGNTWLVNEPELSFGDFSPGRYAWELRNPERLAHPIHARGQQGFWTFEAYPWGTKEK
jgi:hypothetical protein